MATLSEEETNLAVKYPALQPVLGRLHLLNSDGSWKTSDVRNGGLGVGPLIDPAVVEMFMQLDTTRSLKNLEWMLLMAGGGPERVKGSLDALAQAKQAWITERVGDAEVEAPVFQKAKEDAEAAWAEVESSIRDALLPADIDMLELYDFRIFGYGRYWPGPHGLYQLVYNTAKEFLENTSARVGKQSKLSLINQARAQRNDKPVNPNLSDYTDLASVQLVNTEFFYFFKRQQALKDVQFIGKGPEGYVKSSEAVFYEDDNCTAYVPATAAAIMKVGFDNWCVANRTAFDRAFSHNSAERSQSAFWNRYASSGPFCVIVFKGDVTEPDRPEGHEWHKSLQRLAIYLTGPCDEASMREPYPGLQFFDRENRYHPAPVKWPEMAERLSHLANPTVKQSVQNVIQAFFTWAAQRRTGDIKRNVYEDMALMLVWRLLYA